MAAASAVAFTLRSVLACDRFSGNNRARRLGMEDGGGQLRRAAAHHHERNIFFDLLEKHEDGSLSKALPKDPTPLDVLQSPPEVFVEGYNNREQEKVQENRIKKDEVQEKWDEEFKMQENCLGNFEVQENFPEKDKAEKCLVKDKVRANWVEKDVVQDSRVEKDEVQENCVGKDEVQDTRVEKDEVQENRVGKDEVQESRFEKDGTQENWVQEEVNMTQWHAADQLRREEAKMLHKSSFSAGSQVELQNSSERSPWHIMQSILHIAKDLPRNALLGECIDPSFIGHINTECGNEILRSLGNEQLTLQALSFFEWMRMQQPSLLDSKSFCFIITILGQAKMLDRAVTLFHNMPDKECFHHVNVYNSLISALANNERHDEAVIIIEEMMNKNIAPDSITFSILITHARKSGYSLTKIWRIFGLMSDKQVSPNIAVFGSLIKAFCEKHLKEEALVIAREMETKQGFPLNTIIYNTLIDAYGKEMLLEEAEGLFLEMKEKGLRPSVSTYNSLIDAYGRAGRCEVAESFLSEMQDWGLLPDAISYSTLISAYGRQGQSEKAANAFLRMKKSGISPSTHAYTALIHAFSEGGWHVKAEAAFQNMLREGLTPRVETYTALLDAYRQAGDIEKLMQYWKMMRKQHCIGTRVTFDILLDGLAKQGCYVEARDVIFEFANIGIKADRLTYNMLINAYARGGKHEKIADILHEMRTAGIFPDSFTFTTIIYSFLRVRDFTQAFNYFEQMCELHQQPDRETYMKLKALLDLKYDIKKKRDQKSVLGQLRKQNGLSRKGKKTKKFWKRRRPMHMTTK